MPYVYPSTESLKAIAAEKMPALTLNDPLFSFFPIEEEDTAHVTWEQGDNVTGLQQARGMGGKPTRVKRVGRKKYTMEPGVYGEFIPLDEIDLTDARMIGDNGNMDIEKQVLRASDQLQARFVDRVRYIGWTACQGTLSVLGQDGSILHSDTYPVQTASANVAWGTSATATPMKDFRTWKLLQRGKGCSFGRGAKAYMNSATVNKLLNNTNANDLFGKRTSGSSTISSLTELNKIMLDADLPEIVEYDEGYIATGGSFTTFIPDDKVIIIGKRSDGSRIGAYKMTRNINNKGSKPGQYVKVVIDEDAVPVEAAVHNGHNGGPAIEFPGSIIFASV